MERDSNINVETPSTIKKRKTQNNRKTPKSRKKLFSTQKNTILNYFLKNELPLRDFSEENNERTNSSVKESTPSLHKSSPGPSNKNEISSSSIFEISTPSFYLKIKENKSALSSRALNVAKQAISMSTNNDLSLSGRHLNIGTTSDESFQYILKNKIKSPTEKEQLKIAPAKGPGRSVKTLPRPTFVATNQSKVEMKISSNVGNSTIVNSKDEFNTGNVKDNKVKGTVNDNGVLLVSDDSDDENVLPQISVITRNNLTGKHNSDNNQTNDEVTIESSSQGTYSLSGSENTVIFDGNSLSESENSPKIPKNSSVMEKVMIKQDSIRTKDDTNSSMYDQQCRRHHDSDITLDIGNSTIVNFKGEFNTGNVKDNKVKGTVNDSDVLLISDDSDDENVLPQISVTTRNNLIGKHYSDYNQTNNEDAIESSSQGTYSLSGSENTVMFDVNSLSESENSPKIPKISSVMEKVMIKQDSIRTEDDINNSMYDQQSHGHRNSDITLDGEQTQQNENNIFASSDKSNVTLNDLKKTKLREKEKLTENRDKFATFDSSSKSDSDCSRNFSNSSASESDNTKTFITKMMLNKRKKFTRKRDKTILTFSPNESDSDFLGNINYNSCKESDSDAIVTNTHKSLYRKSSCKRKKSLNQYWKVVYDGTSSDSSDVTTAKTDSQETSSKNRLESTKNRITLEDKSKITFRSKKNSIKRDIGRMAYFRAFYENVIIQYDTYTERIISLNEIEIILLDGNTYHKLEGLSNNSQEYFCSKLAALKRVSSSGVRCGEEIELHTSSFIENDVNHSEQDNVRKQEFYSSDSEPDSTDSLDSTKTQFLLGEDSSLVDSDSESDERIKIPKRKNFRKNKCILSSNSDSESSKTLKSIRKSQPRDKKSSNLAKKSTYQRSRETFGRISGSRECRYTKIEEDSFSNSTINCNNRYTSIKTDREKMAPMTYNEIVMKSYIGVCKVALYQTLKQFVSKTRSNYLDLGLVSNIFTDCCLKIRLFLNEKSCRMYNPYLKQGFESR